MYLEICSGDKSSMLWWVPRTLVSWATVLLTPGSARHRLAAPPCAQTRHARGMSRFSLDNNTLANLSSSKPKHTTSVGSGCTAVRGGGVRQDLMLTEMSAQETTVPHTFHGIVETTPDFFPEARTSKILYTASMATKSAADPLFVGSW